MDKICELASKATEDILGVKVLNKEKFAELIIAECCNVMIESKAAKHLAYTTHDYDMICGALERVEQEIYDCFEVNKPYRSPEKLKFSKTETK